jgi:hypothetical protein
MNILIALWALVAIAFLVLLFVRSRLTTKETDWIPLSDDAKETQAIETQKVIEKKSEKYDTPIRILGWLSVIMFLVVVGYWLYHGIMTPPPLAK